MPIITLTTDFGTKDPDLGYLKSQILQMIPNANLIDISHDINPFDMDESIYIVKNALEKFPVRTIHLIALDSETHIRSYPILAVSEQHFYLGNDNGIIPASLQNKNYKIYRLPFETPGGFMKEHIEAIRKLSKGIAPEDISIPINNYKKIKLSKPSLRYNEKDNNVSMISAKVIYNDHYGNAIFNLTKNDFEKWRDGRKFYININNYFSLDKILDYYNDIDVKSLDSAAGNMYARFNHYGYFEIFIYKSNRQSGGANTLLMLRKNSFVNIIFK